MLKATVRAGSNIAFVKYWGVADPAINLPLSSSISMTLADAHTTTTVEWDESHSLTRDQVTIDGERVSTQSAGRITRHLDRLRGLAGVDYPARVTSSNNFPMASGIASSASGFAALTVAGVHALGMALDDSQLSALARLGSGSACRSVLGGFVLWDRGEDDATSVARQLYPPDHWDLYDLVAVVSAVPKATSSEQGHLLAATSPLNDCRIASLDVQLQRVRTAIEHRSLDDLGPAIEQDTLAMHAVMMTSSPSLFYWQPATLEVINAVRAWRAADGIEAYFTIDAGPNVHVICSGMDAPAVRMRLAALTGVEEVIISRPGPAPQILHEHLDAASVKS